MHHPTDRIAHTTAFVTPVVEHWLEREIAQWVHPMKDRSDDPPHHERTLYLWATSRSQAKENQILTNSKTYSFISQPLQTWRWDDLRSLLFNGQMTWTRLFTNSVWQRQNQNCVLLPIISPLQMTFLANAQHRLSIKIHQTITVA